MSETRVYNRSFAGGIVSPDLFGRFDIVKFQTGVKNARNMKVLPTGQLFSRDGLDYIQTTKTGTKKSRLIPFNYNTTQTYILEFGDLYIRFHTGGSTLLSGAAQAITGVTRAATGVLTYLGADPANGTWMYLAGNAGMTQINGRYVIVTNVNAVANTFELYDLFGNPINTSAYGVWTAGGTMDSVYEIASPYLEADLFDLHYVQSADVLTVVHPSYAPRELSRVAAASWTLGIITFAPTIGTPVGQTATPAVSGGATFTYCVTAIAADGLEESLQSANATTVVAATPINATNFITIACTAVAGAIRYNIYRKDDGIYGFIGQSGTNSFRDIGFTPALAITPPNSNSPFTGAGNFPSAVSYSDQRRCFAGTNNRRQTFWMTRAGTESNLSYSIPTRDDDSITYRIAAREANAIRHLVPYGDLIALTAAAAWRIWGGATDVISPVTTTVKPQSYVGANNVQPVVTPVSVLFSQAQGSMAQELVYTSNQDGARSGYNTTDISIFAPHLIKGFSIVDLTYAHYPDKTAWWVRSDGTALGLTYVKEQDVAAWHKHDTIGFFESVATTVENNADRVYFTVRRTINGKTMRYIERLHFDTSEALVDTFQVDSGLSYNGAPADNFRGFYHLEGQTFQLLADGGVHPAVTVVDGAFTLDANYSKVHAGLGITKDVEFLPPVLQGEAFGHGRPKNINDIYVSVRDSAMFLAGPNFDLLTEAKARTDEAYDSAPALYTGVVDLAVEQSWDYDAPIVIRQALPLPLRILSITLDMEIGG